MPGHRRLAISRSRVPNLDGCVIAAAGNLLSIGAPRHWRDPVFVRSQHTNQQKQRGNTWEKNLHIRVPGHRALAKGYDEIMYIFMFFEHLFLKKSHIFEWPVSQTLRQKDDCDVNSLAYWSKRKKHDCVVDFLSYWLKKLTLPSARRASTGNLQIASPKSWWFSPHCRWQFAFHRGSTPQSRPWNW